MAKSMDGLSIVTIVGGGLAGMVAALRLAERGCDVSLYEAADQLGGQAGAKRFDGLYEDHGYKLFPLWYVNLWQLVDELGIRDDFVDSEDFHQLLAGEFPRYRTFRNLFAMDSLPRNLFSGIAPISDMILFCYAALDLLAQPYKYDSLLDQVSINGFLRSRFYRTEYVARQLHRATLRSLAVPSYRISALTVQRMLRYWMRYPKPWYRILAGNTQEYLIDPLTSRLKSLGCRIHTSMRLDQLEVKGNRVTSVTFRDAGQRILQREVDRLVLAIPAQRLARLIDDRVFSAAPGLARVRHLQVRPMATLNIYLNRRMPSIPRDHVALIDSKYDISFIDVARTWSGHDHSIINAIVSDAAPLESLAPETAVSELIDEISRYVPDLTTKDIARVHFEPHADEPLFLNEVGSWQFRPTASTELQNLYLAGCYCRTHVDVVSMEGAVVSGLHAAEALRNDACLAEPVEILQPRACRRWLMVLGKFALLPVAVLAKAVTLIPRGKERR